jgi:TfoX/Sxy family transcriptional regulator of competence genes
LAAAASLPRYDDLRVTVINAQAVLQVMIPDGGDIEVKPMFGSLGAFVNGSMSAGLFGPDVDVRLDDAGRDELAMIEGSGPFGPAERPMTGYLAPPAAWRASPDVAVS